MKVGNQHAVIEHPRSPNSFRENSTGDNLELGLSQRKHALVPLKPPPRTTTLEPGSPEPEVPRTLKKQFED